MCFDFTFYLVTTDNSKYRPKYFRIVLTGVVVFFFINSISLIARGLFSRELLGATISPLILTFVSIILGGRYLKKEKRNIGWGLILGAVINVGFWIYFLVALSIGLSSQ